MAKTAEASEGRNVWLQQDLDDNREPDWWQNGHANVLIIVGWTAFFELSIVHGYVEVRLHLLDVVRNRKTRGGIEDIT